MGLRDQKLSEKPVVKELSAMQLFTDREDPQEAFERKLALINEYRADASGVICYYGIGGVGKTALRTKLCHMINRDQEDQEDQEDQYCKWILDGPIDCDYAVFDFGEDGISKDRRTILSRIKEQLEDKGYSFFWFDMALLMYAHKAGIVITNDKSTSFILDKYPFLNTVFTAANGIPVLGAITSAIQAIDQLPGDFRKLKEQMKEKQYEAEIKKMNAMEPNEILDALSYYFKMDMKTNMTGAKKPLVIFLDTYEKYVDKLNSDTLRIIDDHWLWKGSESVIQSIPGILWVILGREALTWDQGDEHWKIDIPERPLDEMSIDDKEKLAEGNIEQHLLGDLSKNDAKKYMNKAGVNDDELCDELYEKVTKGTPIYIHICIDQYKAISETRKPVLEDFGKDISELITRYLRNMPEHYREMSYFLAILGSWTDDLVYELAPKVSSLHGFNKARYADYVSHSFVVKKLDGTQYLHDVVKEAYLANAGEEIIREVRELLDERFQKKMKDDESLDEADSVGAYIDNILKMDLTYDELYARRNDINERFNALSVRLEYKKVCILCKKLYDHIKRSNPQSDLEKMYAAELAFRLCQSGRILDGYRSLSDYFFKEYELADSEDENIYKMYVNVGRVFCYKGDYPEAIRYLEKAHKGLLRLGGEETSITIRVLSNLASAYEGNGNYKKAKELKDKIYNKRVGELEENSLETIAALSDLANSYDNLGDYSKAKEMREQAYNKYVEILGKEDPDTITALSNLAASYGVLGDYSKAIEMNEQAYSKYVEIFDKEDPDITSALTISSLTNLAISYNRIGKYDKAIEFCEIADRRCRVLLPENHPDTIRVRTTMACSYSSKGDYDESLKLSIEAYDMSLQSLRENHPDTIRALSNLADSYMKCKRYDEAKERFKQAYELFVIELGDNHPDTIKAFRNLMDSYLEYDSYAEAGEIVEEAYTRYKESAGETSPDLIYELARYYGILGNEKKAKELFDEAYKLYKENYGETNRKTIDALYNLAMSHGISGDHQMAVLYFADTYKRRKEILGETDPDTMEALENLINACEKSGLYPEAEALSIVYKRASKS